MAAMKNPKYERGKFKEFFKEALLLYERWREENLKIRGTSDEDIRRKVNLLNEYKDQLELEVAAKYGVHPYFGEGEVFSAQTKIFSSILEEFLYYLFKDLVPEGTRIGSGRAFVELFITPKSFEELIKGHPTLTVKRKDLDFMLGADITLIIRPKASLEQFLNRTEELTIPAVAVECKTNIDKTMLNEAAGTAEFLKRGNPYVLYVILAEYLDFTPEENPKLTKIDQIYILRRMKRPSVDQRTLDFFKNRKPIQEDLVIDFFKLVRNHLEKTWWDPDEAVERGKLI